MWENRVMEWIRKKHYFMRIKTSIFVQIYFSKNIEQKM